MKALLKIGFVAAFCLAGSAAYGQEPVKKTADPVTGKAPVNRGSDVPAKRTEKKSAPAQKAVPPAATRQKAVAPAKKEDVQPVK